jgi:tetratricopeptide (TPR) repeat protein
MKFMKDKFAVFLLSMACIISLIISAMAIDISPVLKENSSATTNLTSDQLKQRSDTSSEFEGIPAISEAEDLENIVISEAVGNISDTKKTLTIGELKYLVDKCVDYDNPLVRHTALVIASRSPGEYTIEQICQIYNYMKNEDPLTNGWSYVQDPRERDYYQSASETLKIGKEAGCVGAGDCDDFAILMAALIEAIGGTTRIVLAYGPSGSHAYTEVYLGQLDDQSGRITDLIGWLKQEYNTDNILIHADKKTNAIWLNLDWGPENKSSIELYHPGGPVFPAEKQYVIRIQNNSYRSVPKVPEITSPTTYDPLNFTYSKDKWASQGRLLYDQGNYEASIDAYSKAIQQNPDNAGAWKNRGAAFNALGRFEEGINCLNKAIDIDPQSGNAWALKGFALNQLGRYEESIECTKKAIEINPQDCSAWNNKGFSFYALGKYDNAIEFYEKAISICPNTASYWSNKGVALTENGKYNEARVCFDRAIELDPENAARYESEKP